MLLDEIIQFFSSIPPFSFLSQEELAVLIDDVALEYYPRGKTILSQGGPPSEVLNVIKRGGVKVFMTSEEGEEIVIDYRSEGEHFGILSVVSGDRSRTTIVAVEDTICYLIPKDRILALLKNNASVNEYFLKSFVIHFIDKTYEESKKKFSGSSDGERLLFTTPVGEIIRRLPITSKPDVTVQQAAEIMTKNRISSLIIVDDEDTPLGIITDRDLREKVVAAGVAVSSPVSAIMSSTLYMADCNEYCFEALLKMIRHKIHHIIVHCQGKLQGMVTNHDFMVLQGSSPAAIVKELSKVQDVAQLQDTSPKLYKAVTSLLREGAKAHNITGLITELAEKIVNSLVEIIERKAGPPPVPYSLFLFDRGARREVCLDLNLNIAVIYNSHEVSDDKQVRAYFAFFREEFNTSLSLCISQENACLQENHIAGTDEWQRYFQKLASEGSGDPLTEFFEMRTIRGNDATVRRLREYLHQDIFIRQNYQRIMIRNILSRQIPLGFYKDFVVDRNGEHTEELNIFDSVINPLVGAVRVFALEEEIGVVPTMRRLQYLQQEDSSRQRIFHRPWSSPLNC